LTNPLVSVIIPTYNRANTIARAIESALKQTYTNIEVIIVDDASGDNTEEKVKAIDDSRIKYMRHETNKGGGAARNTGISDAKGEYIAFLDSDDVWLPEKIEKQVRLFDHADPRVGVIYTGFYRTDGNDRITKQVTPSMKGNLYNRLLEGNFIGTTSVIMAKKECLKQVGGFNASLPSCQDWDLYIKLSKACHYDYIPDPLVRFFCGEGHNKITSNKQWVILGHKYIFDTYNIISLPRKSRARHYYYLGIIYLYLVGNLPKASGLFLKAFIMTCNIYYLKGILLIIRMLILNK
jgi:glycosyltransferase involved in cell wall biosynthesis